MKNYGNSFSETKSSVSASVLAIWAKVDEFYPVGGFIPCDETNTEGKLIPAGTPVSIDKIGGTVTIGGTAPIGLTYQDTYVGNKGCTVTIVTKGIINESLVNVSYTTTQKNALKCITFIKEA
jgi:hypothetical protein